MILDDGKFPVVAATNPNAVWDKRDLVMGGGVIQKQIAAITTHRVLIFIKVSSDIEVKLHCICENILKYQQTSKDRYFSPFAYVTKVLEFLPISFLVSTGELHDSNYKENTN